MKLATEERSPWTTAPADILEVSWVSRTFAAESAVREDSDSTPPQMQISVSVRMCDDVNGMQKRWRMCYFFIAQHEAIGEMIPSITVCFAEWELNYALTLLRRLLQPLLLPSALPVFSSGDRRIEPLCQGSLERTDSFTKTQSTESWEPVNCVIITFVLKQLCNERHLWQEQHEMMMAVT